MVIQTVGIPLIVSIENTSRALFDYSKSETSLLDPTVLLQTSPTVNPNSPLRTDLQTGSRFMCNQTHPMPYDHQLLHIRSCDYHLFFLCGRIIVYKQIGDRINSIVSISQTFHPGFYCQWLNNYYVYKLETLRDHRPVTLCACCLLLQCDVVLVF